MRSLGRSGRRGGGGGVGVARALERAGRRMQWTIHEVARATGTTSRTLRHYDAIGLLPPTSVGANGYRHYDRAALVRLQRILLLRGLGVGLADIGRVLEREVDESTALREHAAHLRRERDRLERQLVAVERTLDAIENETEIDMTEMFDGFDPAAHRDEVAQRWGDDAARASETWWAALDEAERDDARARSAALAAAWRELAARADAGESPGGEAAQALAGRHVEWLSGFPGTPAASGDPAARDAYVRGLGELYVADERFAANYGGVEGAAFVRDALEAWVAARAGR